MASNLPPNFTTHQPLIHSPLKADNEEGIIAPSTPRFFIDDFENYFIDDNGAFFISEN